MPGSLLEIQGYHLKNIPRNRSDKGQNHQGQNQSGSKHTDTHGGPTKQGDETEMLAQPGLHMIGHQG